MCVGTNVLSLNWNMPKTKSFHSSLRHRCICVSFRSFLLDIAIYVYCLRLKPLPVLFDRLCSTMASQAECKQFWLDAPKNRLCAWEVAKALGLREASKEIHGGHGRLPWIAARLTKVGGGCPAVQSLHELFAKIDADPEWFPGKHSGKKRGPRPVLTKAKRRCIAAAAMAAKSDRGEEPSVNSIVLRCPVATLNPNTGKPFSRRHLRKVFLEDCYDIDPDHPWKYQNPLQKIFLPEDLKEHRLRMAQYIQRYGKSPQWWAQHVVWFDPCCSILPGSKRQYEHMCQALKGKKRLISDNAKQYSSNLSGKTTAIKQIGEGTRVNWFNVLCRGIIHVETMPAEWKLDGTGLAAFVERLPRILHQILGPGAKLPRTVFTDRGTGMYTPVGKIVNKYAEALRSAGFVPYWGSDAQRQSPDMGDMLLHETAVAWLRKYLRTSRPEALPWQETKEMWSRRVQQAVAFANQKYDVAGLCREFPSRLQTCIDNGGERLDK